MTRAARFRQADLVRAIKAAKLAGLQIEKIEVDAQGRIVISNAIGYIPTAVDTVAPELSALECWKAKRNVRTPKPSPKLQD